MVTPVEVVNGTLNVIVEEMNDSIFTIILALATLGLAIITGFSFWKTHGDTRESIKITRTEFRHKTRPILARHVHKKELKNVTNQIDGDTYSLSQEKAIFHFINNGSTNAINVRKETFVEIYRDGFDAPMLDPNNPNTISRLADLAPTEYYSVDVEWDRNYYNIAVEDKICYFGLVIWYDDEEGNQYYYHMEGHFDKTMLMLDYVRTGTLKENP